MFKNDVNPLVEDATTEQRTAHKEENTKDFKALYLIHQCVDTENFEKNGDYTSSKEA